MRFLVLPSSMLAPLLAYAADDAATTTLARDGGDAFVSLSLRPFVVAALAQQDAGRPLLVVAGDDRQARDLAADLRTWLSPRPVRFYPPAASPTSRTSRRRRISSACASRHSTR